MRYSNAVPGFTKLFARILDSTVWREEDTARILWITMLALADQDGIVLCTIPGLADRARIKLEECESALHKFQQPDKYSWSKEDEGRRIRPVDGGWFLINHAKYRNLLSEESQREKTRLRVERWRASRRDVTGCNVTETTGNACNDKQKHIAEEEELKSKANVQSKRLHFSIPSLGEVTAYCQERGGKVDPQAWFDHYTANGWKVGRASMKDWRAAVRNWERNAGGLNDSHKTSAQLRNERNAKLIDDAFRESETAENLSIPFRKGSNE